MDKDEYAAVVQVAYLIGHMANDMEFAEAARMAESSMGIAPMIDPTLWMENSDALRDDIKALEAVAELKRAFEKIKRETRTR